MQDVASLRASDSDRDKAAERLHHAMAEGRLSGDELEQRLGTLYAARTYGELDALLADIPANRSLRQPRVRVGRLVGAVSAAAAVLMALGVLAIVRGRAAIAVLPTGHQREVNLPGPLAGPHQGLILVALLGAVLVVLLTSAALVWALMDSRSLRRP